MSETTNKRVCGWMVNLSIPNVEFPGLHFKSIKAMTSAFRIKEPTLRKLVYDKNYKTKKFVEFKKYVLITPEHEN